MDHVTNAPCIPFLSPGGWSSLELRVFHQWILALECRVVPPGYALSIDTGSWLVSVSVRLSITW